jgi:hypothetical protein
VRGAATADNGQTYYPRPCRRLTRSQDDITDVGGLDALTHKSAARARRARLGLSANATRRSIVSNATANLLASALQRVNTEHSLTSVVVLADLPDLSSRPLPSPAQVIRAGMDQGTPGAQKDAGHSLDARYQLRS